ncbi:MAG: hypothetical protein ACRDHF_05435 [Tepidiformaceae bacterium]
MRNPIQFEDREARVVAWVPCELDARDIEERSNRLRSWALIVGATIAGPPYLVLRGAEGARLCLPLAEWYAAHPETGVSVERNPAGPVARLAGATVMDAHEIAGAVLAELGGHCKARGDAEFHPTERGALSGDVLIPVDPAVVRVPVPAAVAV